MALMRFIGDTHGPFSKYAALALGAERSVQVGDHGVGFAGHAEWDAKVAEWHAANPKHPFIDGNHDNLSVCKNMPGWIPRGTVKGNVMYIGGAHSIDKAWRTPMFDWWEDEELSWEEFDAIRLAYMEAKPDVLVCHDFPEECARQMFEFYTDKNASRQRAMLQELFDIRRPELIIGGHWHVSRDQEVRGTRCICLNIFEHIDIDI